ncbi:LysM domain-containing protein [Caloramator sp. CAR-1]|uniref:LysM peptidoglycan-binding domain-containing protein n=1 Tax=Caloramator sp. CAR-1 TaxID=3062777 RepID=UPI0026E169F5|nr:LysM domain-containing protein [Caloramator sp. CAR-1]MDO6353556.1 LysM domain-containing protein [Caloramator sp. CAR-1]
MKKKGFTFLAILVATSTVISISTSFMNYPKKKEKFQRFETYVVQQGDTLWSIAKKYTNGDPRRLIYEIRKHNDISPIIRPGQAIEIPILNK